MVQAQILQDCPTAESAAEFVPASGDLDALKMAARGCRGCSLYCNATQTVFGEGPKNAALMLVGEQPGNDEDKSGRPFTGPAGHILDKALAEIGLERKRVYVTNAVKHFKFILRGSLRQHRSPGLREITACKPWLSAEIAAVKPKVIVCLGTTAIRSLIGKTSTLRDTRQHWFPGEQESRITATLHPSAILRAQENRHERYEEFVRDLERIARETA